MNTMNIEGKVPIAADAAALVIAYLDELNTKLNQAGVKNAYLIVADVESMIIEALKRQGKKTKLGNEEVLSIINEEFDDPDEFIRIYLADMNPETQEDKMDRFMVDPNQRRLVRRPKPTNQQIQEGDKSILTSMFNYMIFSTPLLLMIVAIILNVASSLGNGFSYMMESVVLTILASVIFMIFELFTGQNGKLVINAQNSIEHRYFFRGIYISNLILTYFQYGTIKYDAYNSYYGNLFDLRKDFELILVAYISILGLFEFMIFTRDHLPNYFPLEPEFRPIIRFITPPYLLVGIGLFFIIVTQNNYYELLMLGSTLVLAGIFWAAIRKYKVSSRFYIISVTTIFYASVIINDDIFFWLFPIAVSGLIALLVFKLFTKSNRKKSSFSKIRKMYSEYYDEKEVNE